MLGTQRIFSMGLNRLVCLAISAILVSSCGKSDDPETARPRKTEIRLEEVSSEECLSLPRLFESIRELKPDMPSVVVPTAINFESTLFIHENFRKIISYGQLVIQRHSIASEQLLPKVVQENCTKVLLTGSDREEKSFTVKKASREELMAEAEDGERIHYIWYSPTTILSKKRYIAFNAPCDSELTPILITIARTLDWSQGDLPLSIPERGSPLSIEPSFLDWASAAVNISADSFYTPSAEGVRHIDLRKVEKLREISPNSELLSCSNPSASFRKPNPKIQLYSGKNSENFGYNMHELPTVGFARLERLAP